MPFRKRSVDPAFWDDEKVAMLRIPERLFFISLWSISDDEGRIRFEPLTMHRRCFYADRDVTITDVLAMLIRLAELGFVQIYDGIDAQKRVNYFVHITNFLRYQAISHPSKSCLPPPPILPLARSSEFSLCQLAVQDYCQRMKIHLPSMEICIPDSVSDSGNPPEDSGEFLESGKPREDDGTQFESYGQLIKQLRGKNQPQKQLQNQPQNQNQNRALRGGIPLSIYEEQVNSTQRVKVDTVRERGNGRTVAHSSEVEKAARGAVDYFENSELLELTRSAIALLETPSSPAIFAAVSSAISGYGQQHNCSYTDAHNVIMGKALVLSAEARPESWVDWFTQQRWQTPA